MVSVLLEWGRTLFTENRSELPSFHFKVAYLPAPEMVGLARNEPAQGCILGAYIDLDRDLKNTFVGQDGRQHRLPEDFEAVVGKRHGMYFFYMGYGTEFPTEWVNRLGDQNRYVHIALEPNLGLDAVRADEYLVGLARSMGDSKAKIFLRFASEMNGPWVKYSGDPAKYRAKFALVASIMHKYAPNVAMVWCPYFQPTRTIPDYYPGDRAVDWVGVNMYNVTYFNQNDRTPAIDVKPQEMLQWIYDRYSAKKPIMIGEYATTHESAVESNLAINFAVNNILDLYGSLPTRFPRVKAINYFNTNNLDLPHRRNNDYRVTAQEAVRKAYHNAVTSGYFLSGTNDFDKSGSGAGANEMWESGQVVSRPCRIAVDPGRVDGGTYMEFSLDGEVVHCAKGREQWSIRVDPSFLEVGKREVLVRVLDVNRKELRREHFNFFVAR